MNKKVQFFIDDVIFVFRDLAKEQPKSLFDHPYMNMLKTAHDKYGMKVQLNCFYRLSFFYGMEDFDLTQMPDIYKNEWEENSDWLKLAFHAHEEFPDYPYLNANYDLVKSNYTKLTKEIKRFAGEKCLATGITPHWIPISKEGIQALYDCGVKVTYASYGDRNEDYNGEQSELPYGHSFRFLYNRKPETATYTKVTRDLAIARAICGYNHISKEDYDAISKDASTYLDKETGMRYKNTANMVLNLTPLADIEPTLAPLLGQEYICTATHEQYFYPYYYDYHKDYADRIYKMCEILHDNGYTFIFMEDLVD